MYDTVIKHSGHLKTLEKCRKHSPAARVFYNFLVLSNARRVLSQCNTRLRLLYLLNKPLGTVGRTLEEFANHLSAARDLRIFLVFSQRGLSAYKP